MSTASKDQKAAVPNSEANDPDICTFQSWQDYTGLYPGTEQFMTRDEREAAVRKLVEMVCDIVHEEFDRGKNVPEGERSFAYDPIDYVCNYLGIARVRLSAYIKELTGMRAHELSDAIKANALPEIIRSRLQKDLDANNGALANDFREILKKDPKGGAKSCVHILTETSRQDRRELGGHFAMELGFASLRRLKRACQFATHFTLDELERVIAMQLVQKLQPQQGAGESGQGSEQREQKRTAESAHGSEAPEQQIRAEQQRPETAGDKERGSETRPTAHESSGTTAPKASA